MMHLEEKQTTNSKITKESLFLGGISNYTQLIELSMLLQSHIGVASTSTAMQKAS